MMIKKVNHRISKKIHHRLRLSNNNSTSRIAAALFSIILILTGSVVGLPLLQGQLQLRQAYAYSQQVQVPSQSAAPPLPSPTQEQRPFNQVPPSSSSQSLSPTMLSPICNPNSPITLQLGSTGPKVAELQRILIQFGYGSLLGQRGTDGKFGPSTQNAIKKFQQDNRLQVDGKVGPTTWRALCYKLTISSPTTTGATTPTTPANQQGQHLQQQSVAKEYCGDLSNYKDSSGRSHWIYNRGPWNFEYDMVDGLGLVLYNIKAGNKHLFNSVTVPQFGIEHFDSNEGGMKSRILRFCDPNGSSGTTWTQLPRIISNDARGIDYLEWTYYMRFNEQGNNINDLLIGTLAIKYDIAIRWKPVFNCEVANNECYRLIPKVTFLWIDGTAGNKRPVLNKFTAFYRLDYGYGVGIYPIKDPDHYIGAPGALGRQSLLTKEHLFHAVIPNAQGEIDNIHTARINEYVLIPGCTSSDFDCVHMHWRWADLRAPNTNQIDPMVEPTTSGPVSGTRGTPNLVPRQSIDIAVVRDNPGEPAFPDDPLRKVNDQLISTTNDGYRPTGSAHTIVWYMSSVDMEKTDTFFRHGIFVLKNVS